MKANECAWSLSRTLHALYDLRLKFHFQQEQQQIVTQIDEPNKENDLELLYPWFTTIYARYHNQIYAYFQRDKLFFSFSSSRIFVLIWIVCCCCCSRRSHRMCTLNTENFRLIRIFMRIKLYLGALLSMLPNYFEINRTWKWQIYEENVQFSDSC